MGLQGLVAQMIGIFSSGAIKLGPKEMYTALIVAEEGQSRWLGDCCTVVYSFEMISFALGCGNRGCGYRQTSFELRIKNDDSNQSCSHFECNLFSIGVTGCSCIERHCGIYVYWVDAQCGQFVLCRVCSTDELHGRGDFYSFIIVHRRRGSRCWIVHYSGDSSNAQHASRWGIQFS